MDTTIYPFEQSSEASKLDDSMSIRLRQNSDKNMRKDSDKEMKERKQFSKLKNMKDVEKQNLEFGTLVDQHASELVTIA